MFNRIEIFSFLLTLIIVVSEISGFNNLRAPDQRVVDGGVAVRMVLSQHLPHHAGALAVRTGRQQPEPVHGVQRAPVHRLEAVADVGQRATENDGQRVLQKRVGDLGRQVDGAGTVVVVVVVIVPRGELVGGGGDVGLALLK